MKLIILAAAMIGALFFGAHAATAQGSAPAPVLHGVLKIAASTPCPMEDSINCYWDAGNAGNGKGHSFYSIRVGGLNSHGVRVVRDCIIYWDRAYNRTYGQCYRVR